MDIFFFRSFHFWFSLRPEFLFYLFSNCTSVEHTSVVENTHLIHAGGSMNLKHFFFLFIISFFSNFLYFLNFMFFSVPF